MEECKELVRQLHREEQIRFLGYVSNMRDVYVACDACVSTSQIEGLPFNIMEAIACGLPVVASDIKGHRELVKDGNYGILYKSGDPVELQKKLKYINKTKASSGKSEENIRVQLGSYELNQVVEQILEIYN